MSVERFLIKTASLASILPAAAGAPLGALGGRALAQRFNISPETATMLGGITGATLGGLVKEKVEEAQDTKETMPPGAPYALDATSAEIPPWAVQGARLLQPAMKQAGHFGDIIGGDLGGLAWPVASGLKSQAPAGDIMRDVAGQGLGTLGGGLVGHAAGGLIDKAVGHEVMGPLGVPLSALLAGLGATIGNVKGLELARR